MEPRFKHISLDQVVCLYGDEADELDAIAAREIQRKPKQPRLSLQDRATSSSSTVSSSSVASTASSNFSTSSQSSLFSLGSTSSSSLVSPFLRPTLPKSTASSPAAAGVAPSLEVPTAPLPPRLPCFAPQFQAPSTDYHHPGLVSHVHSNHHSNLVPQLASRSQQSIDASVLSARLPPSSFDTSWRHATHPLPSSYGRSFDLIRPAAPASVASPEVRPTVSSGSTLASRRRGAPLSIALPRLPNASSSVPSSARHHPQPAQPPLIVSQPADTTWHGVPASAPPTFSTFEDHSTSRPASPEADHTMFEQTGHKRHHSWDELDDTKTPSNDFSTLISFPDELFAVDKRSSSPANDTGAFDQGGLAVMSKVGDELPIATPLRELLEEQYSLPTPSFGTGISPWPTYEAANPPSFRF
ncbi:hypothetical protein OIO90_004560 [Microbotryomycetes sp. JL221]|nr:hypothetical protein OIO90_004560 [Microbotryomycetes sp. JL221]